MGRDPNRRAVRRVFRNAAAGRSVRVGRTHHRVVVDVGHRNRERLAVDRAIARGRQNRDGMAGRALRVEQRAVRNRHNASRAIDRKPTAGVIAQRVADGRAQVRIGGRAVIPTAVPVAAFSATLPPVAPSVSVGPTTALSLTLVTATVKRLAVGRAIARGRQNRDVMAGRGLRVEQRAVRNRHNASSRAIDRKPTAGVIAAERVADGRAQVRMGAAVARDPNRRAVRRVFAQRCRGQLRPCRSDPPPGCR